MSSKKIQSDKLPNCLFHSSYVPSSLKETEGLTSCIALSKSYKNKPEKTRDNNPEKGNIAIHLLNSSNPTLSVTGRISSLFSNVISVPCFRASLKGPIEASFTRFFMSEPEYPENAHFPARVHRESQTGTVHSVLGNIVKVRI